MLDQSFSLDNLKTIFEIENRKGGFPRIFFSDEYIDLSDDIQYLKKAISDYKIKEEDDPELSTMKAELDVLVTNRDNQLENELLVISKTIEAPDFGFVLKKFHDPDTDKFIYTVDQSQAIFFAMKQLQYNIFRSFKVKQNNRHEIAKQVKTILQDDMDKYIVRTDIQSFYESVSQKKLFQILDNNQLLSPKSKKFIRNIIYHYNVLSGQMHLLPDERKGVPRGAGISAYLSELYMRTVDEHILQIPDLVYYGRYVDDIIAIFVPQSKVVKDFYLAKIKQIVILQKLQLNSDPKKNKSYQVDAYNSTAAASITFLGYRFEILNKRYAGIFLSENKIDKYTIRLEAVFTVFLKDKVYNYSDSKKLLIHRLNYLTKNTKLLRPKKGLVGIYYSNSLLEPTSSCLDNLNSILRSIINKNLPYSTYPGLNERLQRFCFKKGFVYKQFFNINSKKKKMVDPRSARLKSTKPKFNEFERIVSAWKL